MKFKNKMAAGWFAASAVAFLAVAGAVPVWTYFAAAAPMVVLEALSYHGVLPRRGQGS